MKDILLWECEEGCTCVEDGHVHYTNKQYGVKKRIKNNGEIHVSKRKTRQ